MPEESETLLSIHMKITNIETILLTGPCTFDPFLSEARQVRSAAFIKIKTDNGLIGIGETYAGYFFPEVIPEIVAFFKPILMGNDVSDIPELWRRMYHCANFWCRVGLGASVLCGIEAALWDLRGKELGLPVYKILQEKWKREFMQDSLQTSPNEFKQLPCYATGGPSNYPINKLIEKVEYYLSLGFKGVKVGVGAYKKDTGFHIPSLAEEAVEFEGKKIECIRQQLGNDIWLMLDAHMGNSPETWGLETAMAVAKSLEPFNLLFLEEPLHYTRPDLYSELCRNTRTPIAGGECLTAVCEWQTFIENNSFDIGQPDASFMSGMDQFMKVAAMFHQRGKKIAPHAWGAGVSQMQNIHCGFACPNTAILEVAPAYGPLHGEIIGDSLQIKDGYVLPPEKPGIGITLSDETIRRFPFKCGSGEFNSVPGKILTR